MSSSPNRWMTVLLALTMALGLPSAVIHAQPAPDLDAPETSPLAPPDLSSPRDTLRSFLTNITIVIEAIQRGEPAEEAYRAWARAVEALDFTDTAHGGFQTRQTARAFLLKEVLDRIPLPAFEDIPGDAEVAYQDLTQWTIPGTTLTITRIDNGPRAGDFVFSARTVAQLDRTYILVRDLPYRPGATPGIYEQYIDSDNTILALQRRALQRLRPIDTSSPRATLEGFLDSVTRAYRLILGANQSLGATLPGVTTEEAREIERRAEALLARAMGALDLSEVPQALREDVGIETVLILKEIIDRLPPVLRDSVPDERQVRAARQRAAAGNPVADIPQSWTLPGTEIEIVEIRDGPRRGEFLFSTGTVDRAGDIYDQLRDLPYGVSTSAWADSMAVDFIASDLSEGFLEFYQQSGGYLVPNAYALGRLASNMPDWLKTMHFGQTLWQWIALVVCVLAAVLAAFAGAGILLALSRRLPAPFNQWGKVPGAILIMVIAGVTRTVLEQVVGLTGDVLAVVTTATEVILFTMTAWVVFRLLQALAETAIQSRRFPEKGVDANLLRIGTLVLGVLIGAWIIVAGVQNLGVDLVPLLAGLGVGGLAVALAAQSLIANFIGSLILYANRPVRVGDFCRYGDQIGTVEDIGVHSTRIRSLERTIVTVPNAQFSTMPLDNFSKRDLRLLHTVLQLRYETTPDQMRYVLARLRELLLGHPKVTPEPARVRFVSFGAYSKDLEIFAYLRCQDQDTYLAIIEDILLRVDDIVAESGTGFAFPSQTAYLARDTGLDAERGEQAARRVDEWRLRGKLPFPEFEDEERERLEDILDYPPKGSPDGG